MIKNYIFKTVILALCSVALLAISQTPNPTPIRTDTTTTVIRTPAPTAATPKPASATPKPSSAAAATKKDEPSDAKGAVQKYSSSRKQGAVPSKKGGGKGKGSKHYKSTYQVPVFQEKADPNLAILYFYPPDRQVVLNDEIFSTILVLSNPRGMPFNKVSLAIKYDPAILAPVSYEDRLSTELLNTPPQMTVYAKEGFVVFNAELSKPFLLVNDELLAIQWKPLLPQKEAALSFAEFKGQQSGLFLDSMNILGDPAVPGDGMLDASITIFPKSELSEEDEEELPEPFDIIVDRLEHKKETEGVIALALSNPKDIIREGQIFDMDILFSNSKGLPIDNVSLEIRFDPKVLQVVDYDEDNWITRDVNIHDGDSTEIFPFDYHIANTALNHSGRIIYKMGIAKSDVLVRTGVMATIRFIAIAPADKTKVYFHRASNIRSRMGTYMAHAGQDMLGSADDPHAGILNSEFMVLPRAE
ncbi:MAG TPA: cohesin domain-containing protein [Candidatus Sumerlaeota bacterium]|nr:MAG: Cohesin domain protein [candidate division BRC1 bacterium ADurb.Bin183]HOE62910.1 cohesin domain-containing protein [Candidatus Sumerlaeota bacterium]HRR29823.1 cohesin domain-containing protein [Candidatus Sumerlaeia bacterium]HON50259.1 cohesin domain-containing protein [Candidatus Sumerlaeota bacterium]HOR63476.1 cohesin domain-containing protein [Candidatus Sumerlaeota bacterium]